MNFCTRCSSRLVDRESRLRCGARRHSAWRSAPTKEHPPAAGLLAFIFANSDRTLLNLVERRREVRVPLSCVSAIVIEVQTHEDTSHPLKIGGWSQDDEYATGPQSPIVGHKWEPTRKNLFHLKLGSGAGRSFVLRQIRFAAHAGHRIMLIFPVIAARALDPIYDYAAIGADNYATNDQRWSTVRAEMRHALGQLSSSESKRLTHGVANHLDGLCRRCLRLLNPNRRSLNPKPSGAAYVERTRW